MRLPLGGTTLIRPTSMVNILGEDTLPQSVLSQHACHIHWYGKDKRPGRKMGHINVCADDQKALSQELIKLADQLDETVFPALRENALKLG